MKTENLEQEPWKEESGHQRSLRGCLESYAKRFVSEEELAQACDEAWAAAVDEEEDL